MKNPTKWLAMVAMAFLPLAVCSSCYAEADDGQWNYRDRFAGEHISGIATSLPVDDARKEVVGLSLKEVKKEELTQVLNLYPNLSYLNLDQTDPDQWGGRFYSELAKFKNLRHLQLNLTGSNNIPDDVKELKTLAHLTSLGISQARAIKRSPIPTQLYTLTSLKELWLYYCVSPLPNGISKMKGLRHLRLFHVPLSGLPSDFKELKISYLLGVKADATGTDLLPLPSSLQMLDLSGCNLTVFPREILGFRSLQVANLSGNRLTEVPADLRRMKKLRSLNLSANAITNVPTFLFNKQTLKSIDLRYNPILHSDSNPAGLVEIAPTALIKNPK